MTAINTVATRPIFNGEFDRSQVLQDLRNLTEATRYSHSKHDFLSESWDRAIVGVTPLGQTGNLIAQIELRSPAPLQDGDMVAAKKTGCACEKPHSELHFIFDVARQDGAEDLYTAHAAIALACNGIGHFTQS
jgi:hypothetical protein